MDKSTNASPIVPAPPPARELVRPSALIAALAAELRATAARKLFSLASIKPAPVAVPGVSTRITSRRTIFLPGPGSSICSQIATLCPARINRAM